LRVKKGSSDFDLIRLDFPPVTWRAGKNCYMIGARAKGVPRQNWADRTLAGQLAVEFDSKDRSGFAANQTQAEALKKQGRSSRT
jgi:hypothetical protein